MSRSLYQTLKKDIYRVSFDKDFVTVIKGCATAPRKDSTGTWITEEMIEAYTLLHKLGFAHSVEVWFNDKIVGGLYGISIGRAFFGESMFTLMKDASKVAISCLVEHLILNNFYFIDCQITNKHLIRLGAYEIPRSVFLILLKEAVQKETLTNKWDRDFEFTSKTAKFLKEKLIPR
jgi:leucyl/phenylalanyl-tRNA--protein transferase